MVTLEEYEKMKESELVKKFEEVFPKMIEKKQAIWIVPIVNHFPNVIRRLEQKWELEFIYDEETGSERIFMKPLFEK